MIDEKRRRRRSRGRSVALAGLVACGPAAVSTVAQQAEEMARVPADRPTYYETATVRARPVDKATASVTVLDREQIEALEVRTVAELIRFIPGVDVSPSGPRGGLATAQIRGGDPNFTVVLLDGVPLNDTTDPLGGAVNLNSLSVRYVERIEVVRGPLSSFFGSTGLAGAINIITRRGATERPELGFEVAAGNAEAVEGAISVSRGNDSGGYLLGLSWEEEEGRIADDRFEQLALHGTFHSTVGRHGAVRVSGRWTTWEGDDYPDASGGPVFGTGRTRHSDHDEASLGVDLTFGGSRRQRAYATLYRGKLDRESPGVPPHPSNPFLVVPPSVEQTLYTRARLGWLVPLRETSGRRWTVGVELDREDGDNDSTLLLPPIFGGPTPGSYEIERTTAGAFFELVSERGPVIFDLGVRVDEPEGFDAEISPRVGFAYRLRSGATRLHASAARGFKLPSFFALASPPALGGNPDLDPEITLGADAGVEHEFTAADLRLAFTVFWQRFDDLITFDFASFRHVNLDEVRSRGAEVSLDWRPTDRIDVRVSVTGQDIEQPGSAEPLRQRPDWFGGARFAWRPTPRLRWSVDGQWASESFDRQIPVPQRDHTAGYALFGTTVAYALARGWSLDGRVDNLADKRYETFIGFPGPARGYRIALRYRPL